MRRLTLAIAVLLVAIPASGPDVAAQDAPHFRQMHIKEVIERRSGHLDDVPEVFYEYWIVEHDSRLEARLMLYHEFGEDNRGLLQILNRNDLENLHRGDTLVVPTDATLDFRAYSPFPRYWPGAMDIDKVVILDKNIQAFAAYEWGRLERWGIINTGTDSRRTPAGRFNVNWKQDYRVSTLSPPGEPWEMYWVMNLHEGRGIHMHQYALPMGGPASYGCIRMSDPDARWLYAWTDTWDKTGGTEISSAGATVHELGTMVLIIGEDISGDPQPFIFRNDHPVLRVVHLPVDPYDVAPGTNLQERFDRQRAREMRAAR
jgi:hypothetical protein